MVAAAGRPTISSKVVTVTIDSDYQHHPTDVQLLLPRDTPRGALRSGRGELLRGERLSVIYLLPVEAGYESVYGDPVEIACAKEYADRYRAIFVCPRFDALPWYGDHPTDMGLRQESYLLNAVLPLIEERFPAAPNAAGRHLVGFSKSGWGAFALILRHPNIFGTAAVFDAPLMLDRPGFAGSGIVFPTPESFLPYHIPSLLQQRARELGATPRLALGGSVAFEDDMRKMGELLRDLGVPYVAAGTPEVKRIDVRHIWDDRWMRDLITVFAPAA